MAELQGSSRATMIDAFKIGVELSMVSNMGGVLNYLARDVMGLSRHVDLAKGRFDALKLAAVGAMAAIGGVAALEGLHKLIEAAKDLQSEVSKLPGLGFTPAQVQSAKATAFQTMQAVPGSTPSGNVRDIGEMRNILGNPEEAEAVLPDVERAKTILSARLGTTSEHAMQTVVKMLEMRGHLMETDGKLSLPQFRAELDAAVRAVQTSNGVASISDLAQFVKRAGISAKLVADPTQFWPSVLPAIEDQGGSAAGTATSALSRMVIGHTMPDKNRYMLQAAGLIDPTKVHQVAIPGQTAAAPAPASHNGHRGHHAAARKPKTYTQMDMDAVVGFQDYVQKGQQYWVENYLKPGLMKQYHLGNSAGDQQALQSHVLEVLSTETARRLASLAISNKQQYENTAKNYAATPGLREADTLNKTDPVTAERNLAAATKSFMEALGDPLMPQYITVLNTLSAKLRDAAMFASQHPTFVKDLGELTAALSALMIVGGGLATAAGALRAMSGALGLFSAGAPAGAALATLGGGVTVAGSLAALAAAVVLLPPAMRLAVDGLNEALNIKAPQSGSAARGAGHGPYDPSGAPKAGPGVGEEIGNAFSQWWNRQGGTGAHGNTRGQAPTSMIQKSSYIPPNNRPIHVENIMYLDGKQVYRSVTKQMARDANREPDGGTPFDSRMGRTPPGALVPV